MTLQEYQALRDRILTGAFQAECAPYVILPEDGKVTSKNGLTPAQCDQAIADILNDRRGQTRVVETFVNARLLMSKLGASVGSAILDKLDAAKANDARVKWALSFMVDGGLNVGDPETRTALDDLAAAGVLTAEERDAIKMLAEVPASQTEIDFGRFVTGADVSIALRGGNGFTPGV
jgi:hypothetical protein